MKIAETFIKSLDVRHRQVALTIKIIDVSLTKSISKIIYLNWEQEIQK